MSYEALVTPGSSTLHNAQVHGFAGGTLPGHPETGEEAFVVELRDNGTVRLAITRPPGPRLIWRTAGALGRAQEIAITNRYLRAAAV